MLILDRQNKVLQYVKSKKVVTVTELAEYFKVHEATIRRDLTLLEKEKKLIRTHGGAMIEDEVHSEPSFQERAEVEFEIKQRIGQFAATLINDGDNIILDSGTTTLHIADAIKAKRNLTVITNDINIAASLRSEKDITVIVTGGVLFPDSYMLNGMITNDSLNKMHVHTAFIGTPAFHHRLGLTHFDEQLVPAKKGMIKAAKKTVVVTDHTKIGKISLHNVAELKEIDMLITGKELDEEIKKIILGTNIDAKFV